MSTLPSPHRVVILGAGMAGLRTAVELEKRQARLRACTITLVDQRPHHEYHALLYEVCSGMLEDGSIRKMGTLRAGVSVSLHTYGRLPGRKHIQFVQGEVTNINQEQRCVHLADGTRLPYDDVVIALGSIAATYNIPGVETYAIPLKRIDDASQIRERLAELMASCRAGDREGFTVLIAGGGPTGTELAAELGNIFQHHVRRGQLKMGAARILLFEAGPDILSMIREPLRRAAHRRLRVLGVDVQTQTHVLEVTKEGVRMEQKGVERREKADLVVWAGGIAPAPANTKLGCVLDEKGYVPVESTFEVKGTEHMYALGDGAAFLHPKTGARVPPLGQAAVREAVIVAENITRRVERHALVSWSPPERWITVVPLGGKFALADFGWCHLSGLAGYAIRKIADFLYFFSILPARTAWHTWARGASVYMKND